MLKTTVIGQLGRDAKANEVNGKFSINFSVAHNEKFPDSQTGEMIEKTTWVNCSIFSKTTNRLKYLTKGSRVYVEGKPSVKIYSDKDGKPNVDFSLFVTDIQFLSSTGNDGQDSQD